MWVKSTENVTPSSDPKNHHKEVTFKRANVTAGEYKTVQNCSHGGATSRAAAAWRFADWVDALTADCSTGSSYWGLAGQILNAYSTEEILKKNTTTAGMPLGFQKL